MNPLSVSMLSMREEIGPLALSLANPSGQDIRIPLLFPQEIDLSEFRLLKKPALGVDTIATGAFECKWINDPHVDRPARQLRSAATMSDMEIDRAVGGAKHRADGTVDIIKPLSRLHTAPAQRPPPPWGRRAIAIDPALSLSKGQ